MLSQKTKAAGLVALAVVIVWGCESSDVLAPSGSMMSIAANPQTVIIDVDAGETEGESVITAQLFDSTGEFPLEGVDVTFSSTGGSLAASDNSCTTRGTCKTTGGSCSLDIDCPTISVQTDANGVARDVLTLTTDDTTPVDVNVISAMASATVSVDKSELRSLPPTVTIVASPPNVQARNTFVTFDASVSADPGNPDPLLITCYEWIITSLTGEEVIHDTLRSDVLREFPEEQEIAVTVRVSERADADTFCVPGPAAPESFFSAADSIAYEIACDLTSPEAEAGPATVRVTLSGGSVTVPLSASDSSDPESDNLTYKWNCGNGTPIQTTEDATCTYTSATTLNNPIEVLLTVTNDCGMNSFDTVRVTVLNP